MIRTIGRIVLAATLVALVIGSVLGPVGAHEAQGSEVRRVLVISVPGLRWQDLDGPELPALRALLDESAVASLATRVTHTITQPGEAYLTMGAGSRALAPPSMAGLAFGGDEPMGVGTAAEEYARQQGVALPAGGVTVLSWPLLISENAGAEFDATLGTLGQALADAGVARGVVGNADMADPLVGGGLVRGREAASVMADRSGSVPCGAVGSDLLTTDPVAPYGQRLDPNAVIEAVTGCSTPRSVVLVEASDLRRATAFEDHTVPALAQAATREALIRTDALVAALLPLYEQRDAIMVVAPTTGRQPGLGVLGIRAPGFGPGLLTSGTTRRDGYALLVDLAPSIASLADVDMDAATLEGRPVEFREDARSPAERRHDLAVAEERARFRDDMLEPVVLALVTAVSALALVAALAFVCGWRRAEPWLAQAALVLLAFPSCTYLAALLPFDEWGAGAYWAVVGGASIAISGVARLLRGDLLRPLLATYGALALVVTVSVVFLGSKLQMATVFGDSPVVAGRFSGINNVTFAFLLGAAVVLAAAIVHLVPGQRGQRAMVAFLIAVLAVDVAPMWGADVGGVLAGLPALALVATGLGRWRVRWRTVALTVAATFTLVVILGLLDLTRVPADRSHLGRLFERVGSEGLPGLTTVMQRKLSANLRSLTASEWRYLLVPVTLAAGLIAWRARDRAEAVVVAFPALGRAMPGLAALAVLGYAANDSGIAVPGALLAFVVPGLIYLACRVGPDRTGVRS